jgi:hypothetical protein
MIADRVFRMAAVATYEETVMVLAGTLLAIRPTDSCARGV